MVEFNKDKARYISDPKEVTKNSSVKQPVVKKKSYATESEDSGEDMVYLQPASKANSNVNRRVKSSLSAFLEDSDSENEEGAMEKLAVAISDLFTGIFLTTLISLYTSGEFQAIGTSTRKASVNIQVKRTSQKVENPYQNRNIPSGNACTSW